MGKTPSLQDFLHKLDRQNDLARIDCHCAPTLEIGEIAHRVMSQTEEGKALLFTNTGTPFPVAINLYGSSRRMLQILRHASFNTLAGHIETFIDSLTAQPTNIRKRLAVVSQLARVAKIAPRRSRRAAACQQISMDPPDLTLLPALKCWPADAAPFLTLPMVITEHPETHARNVGMYRIQIINSRTAALHWHIHKTGAAHYRAYRALGKPMPIAVALGGDPLLGYCATAPLPEGIDEWLLAGFLRNRRVLLSKAKTVPLLVPAEADFIIEGYVDTSAPLFLEGPFGDHTGFYSLADHYPTFHVTAITHRRDAIFPATIVGIPPMEDANIALATERIFNVPLRKTLAPEITSFALPSAGVAHNLAIASVKSVYPAQAERLANLFWSTGQLMFTKFLLVVDETVDPHDWRATLHAAACAASDATRFHYGYGPLDALDHSSPKACEGGKLLLDARGVPTSSSAAYQLDFQHQTQPNGTDIGSIRIGKVELATIVPTKDCAPPLAELTAEQPVRRAAPFTIVVDASAPWRNPYLLLWLTLANCAPDVDMLTLDDANGKRTTICDARMKSGWKERRPWPNPVASDLSTINAVDGKWASLSLGPLIPSPSLPIRGYQNGQGAEASRGNDPN